MNISELKITIIENSLDQSKVNTLTNQNTFLKSKSVKLKFRNFVSEHHIHFMLCYTKLKIIEFDFTDSCLRV